MGRGRCGGSHPHLTLGFFAKTIYSSRTSDLACDELRLLKWFNEQAMENQSRDLSVGLQRIRPGTIGMRSSRSD
jgi:hypothetical protein